MDDDVCVCEHTRYEHHQGVGRCRADMSSRITRQYEQCICTGFIDNDQ